MSDITREEFASAVAATTSSVHHLYREVTRLIEGLRDALSEEPGALIPVRGSAVGKSRLNPARFVVRDAYGALFKPVAPDEEVDAAEDDEEESDADVDDGGQGRTRRPVELVADQPLLAVRMVIYDPRKQDGIEPQIQFGVMSDWRVGSDEATEGQRFILDRAMLRRVPLSLGAAVGSGQARRLQANATVKRVEGTKHKKSKDLKLSYQLPVGVETVPLYSLDSPEELRTLAKSVRTMWNNGAPLVGRDRDGTARPAPIAMADDRRPEPNTYFGDAKIVILDEAGRSHLQWKCYEHGIPWEKNEKNAVLEARLRKAGIKLPSEETLEELQEQAARRGL